MGQGSICDGFVCPDGCFASPYSSARKSQSIPTSVGGLSTHIRLFPNCSEQPVFFLSERDDGLCTPFVKGEWLHRAQNEQEESADGAARVGEATGYCDLLLHILMASNDLSFQSLEKHRYRANTSELPLPA